MQPDIDAICTALQELQGRRKFWIGAINKHTNSMGALTRRYVGFKTTDAEADREKAAARATRIVTRAMAGKLQDDADADVAELLADDYSALAESLKAPRAMRNDIELRMKRTVRKLPVAAWAADIRGLGELGLAVIVGETGNLSNYATERKVWRRLGLGMAPGHEAHAYSTWRMKGGLNAEDWTAAGYAPRRRAEIHACVAEPMAKHQLVSAEKSGTPYGLPQGPYGEAYVRRRERTAISHPEGTAAECKADPQRWTRAHAKMDALRVMTKELVSDLWSEWRRPSAGLVEYRPVTKMAAAQIYA